MGRKPVRKWITVFGVIVMAVSLSGCGSQESDDATALPVPTSSETVTEMKPDAGDGISVGTESSAEEDKILIAYFTWAENAKDISGVDAITSASVQMLGNVAQMAAWIQQETGGDLFSIRMEEPYYAVLPDSEIETNVLGVYRDDIPECQETLNNWLAEIGY